jgi:hypothetical protein
MNQKGKENPLKLTVWNSLQPKYYWNSTTKLYPIDMNKFDLQQSIKGAPPNFTHSIDAAHMQMATVKCHEEGISSLSMVHDSYGCHAANINKLRRIVRQSFIDIHRHLPLDLLEKANKNTFNKGDRVTVSFFQEPILGTIAEAPKLGDTDASVKLDDPTLTVKYPIVDIEILDDALAEGAPTDFDNFIEKIGLKEASYIIG